MAATAIAMQIQPYDVWGAMIILPPLLAGGWWILSQTFVGEQRILLPIVAFGLGAKMAGSLARYWVAFDAYGGQSDAARYHDSGKVLALAVREGRSSLLAVIPHEVGTAFIDRLTGLIYTFAGSSQLAGFLIYAFLSFWGQVLFLKAGLIGIHGINARRYAWLCMLTPSIVFWPSSIGKEAWMCLTLGLTSWACALILTGRWRFGVVVAGLTGLIGAGFVRPHMAALWVGGLLAGLFAGFLTGRTGHGLSGRMMTFGLLTVAAIGLVVVGTVALRYLNPSNDEGSVSTRVGDIFSETARRSDGGGSAMSTVSIRSPLDWPLAIQRTLLRPAPHEVRGLSSAFPGAESAALIVALLVGWRRLLAAPRLLINSPYFVAATITVIAFGLAFSTLGNLAILVRQRSLVFPLMLLWWSLPAPRSTPDEVAT